MPYFSCRKNATTEIWHETAKKRRPRRKKKIKAVFFSSWSSFLRGLRYCPKVVYFDLVMLERYQWVYFRRPPRRNITSQKRDTQQRHRNHAERQRVGRSHAKKQAFHPPRQGESRSQPNHYS